jgi:RNA polymerase primary sigma factor/RNA polymerase sigma factor
MAKRRRACRPQADRAALEARVARILALPLEYVPSKEFVARNAAERILAPTPESIHGFRKARQPSDLPPYLASLYEIDLLTPQQERHLFRKYNFLKCRASKLRSELNPARPTLRLLDEIEELHRQAAETRNQIVRSNLRLVVSIVKKYASTPDNFFELTSEGNMTLMNAVEKFDYTRGFKFSTYATWAVKNQCAGEYRRRVRDADRFQTGLDEQFDWTKDERSDEYSQERLHEQRQAQFAKILGCLSDREQGIIRRRYGLGQSEAGQTFKEIGREYGVTKERIRQLEARALVKLRAAAAAEKIEAP